MGLSYIPAEFSLSFIVVSLFRDFSPLNSIFLCFADFDIEFFLACLNLKGLLLSVQINISSFWETDPCSLIGCWEG